MPGSSNSSPGAIQFLFEVGVAFFDMDPSASPALGDLFMDDIAAHPRVQGCMFQLGTHSLEAWPEYWPEPAYTIDDEGVILMTQVMVLGSPTLYKRLHEQSMSVYELKDRLAREAAQFAHVVVNMAYRKHFRKWLEDKRESGEESGEDGEEASS